MKIGYFVGHFPYDHTVESKNYHCGGAENAAYCLALEMSKKYELEIFTTSTNSKDSIETYENILIHRYGTNFRLLSSNISLGMFSKPAKHDVDIVHIHFDIPPGPLAGLKFAKKKNIPLVVTYHGDWVGSYGGIIRRAGVAFQNRYMVDKILLHADVIISPSRHYINESNFLGKYKDKIVVIPNGVNLKDFDIPYDKEECRRKLNLPVNKKIVLFLSYLSPYKGPDILIKAMTRIVKAIPDTELVFVGKGAMMTELKALSEILQIEKNVIFTGFVDDDLRAFYYKAADVFCLPSTLNTEVFPLVLLEASASGLPMVVSDLETFNCIIEEGCNGLISKKRDDKNLADAIIFLLENEDIRKKMGIVARNKVEIYSWGNIAEETEKIYDSLI